MPTSHEELYAIIKRTHILLNEYRARNGLSKLILPIRCVFDISEIMGNLMSENTEKTISKGNKLVEAPKCSFPDGCENFVTTYGKGYSKYCKEHKSYSAEATSLVGTDDLFVVKVVDEKQYKLSKNGFIPNPKIEQLLKSVMQGGMEEITKVFPRPDLFRTMLTNIRKHSKFFKFPIKSIKKRDHIMLFKTRNESLEKD